MHKRMKPFFFYNFGKGIVSNRLRFSLIFSLLFFAMFATTTAEGQVQERVTLEEVEDVDLNTPGDQPGHLMTFYTVDYPDGYFESQIGRFQLFFIGNGYLTYDEYTGFKSFTEVRDDIYELRIGDLPSNEDPPPDESSTGNSPTPPSQSQPRTAPVPPDESRTVNPPTPPPSQPEPRTDPTISNQPPTEQATKVFTPDESSTGSTPAQQAAPQSSTGNTPTQQAAPQTSTRNTPGTPHSVTTNTPADTTGTQTPDTPEQQASDLVVDALKANKDVLDAGESFTISAIVRNQGEGASEAIGTLTYYQYFDDKSVEKVGESDIASLAAGETTDVRITLTAPETSGTHSYYACVRTHCTSIVKISVRSEIKEFVISSGNNQTGTPNKDLPNPISVQVLGEDGRGVPRVKVIFRVVSGKARMRRAGRPKRWRGTSVWTDSEGYAKAYVTPVDTKTIKIRASVNGLDPVVFTVNPEQVGSAPSAQPQSNVTALLANYPNPFNPETWIPYRLAKASEVVVEIFASNGQIVRRLQLGHQSAGIYQSHSRAAYWDGKNE